MKSKLGGLGVVSRALNEGALARAQIATVLLGIPDPPPLSIGKRSRDEMIKLITDLWCSDLIKADWDPEEHPRWPAGAPDSQGGQFAPSSESEACNATVTARRKWMRAKGKEWPKDTKTGRYQDVAHIRARADGGSDEPDNIRPLPHDEHVREHMMNGDFSRWARQGWAARSQTAGTAPNSTPEASAPAPGPLPETAPTPGEPFLPGEILPDDIPIFIPE
jgi:hypothetical protein